MLEAFEVVAPTGKRIVAACRNQLDHGAPRDAAARRRPHRSAGASRLAAGGGRGRGGEPRRILAEWTGARIHILHISSADELRPLREAKARGVDITGETCPQYLLLSTDDYARFGGVIRVNPPVREKRNQEPLWAALHDGTIDMIATDHAPHTPEEKTRNDIWTVDCGFPGRRDADAADAHRGECRPHVDFAIMCAGAPFNPAKIWGLYPRKGVIQPGADADIAVVDLGRELDHRRRQDCSRARRSRRGTAAR